MKHRLRFFLTHLFLSAVVIGGCLGLILLLWYPGGLAALDGVYGVLLVMALVDVGVGPLCTLVAAAPGKERSHLVRDLTVIGVIQLAALGYALYTTASARPAFLVYSFGQIDIEHANELDPTALARASSPEFATPPWSGPLLVEARLPADPAEAQDIMEALMKGGPALKEMPARYVAWSPHSVDVRRHARPGEGLPEDSAVRADFDRLLRGHGLKPGEVLMLPIVGKVSRGIAVLKASDLGLLGTLAPPAE